LILGDDFFVQLQAVSGRELGLGVAAGSLGGSWVSGWELGLWAGAGAPGRGRPPPCLVRHLAMVTSEERSYTGPWDAVLAWFQNGSSHPSDFV